MSMGVVYETPAWVSGVAIVLAAMVACVVAQLVVHAALPVKLREQHTSSVTAIFSVIGVTFAVLLAFVAMLTWESFNKARADTFAEAGAVAELRRLTLGLPADDAAPLRAAIDGYVRAVVYTEWPAQARGEMDLSGESWARDLHRQLARYKPVSASDGAVAGQFLAQLGTLSAARQGRLAASQPAVPGVVWAVMLIGGGLMVAFSALLEAPNRALHLLMTAALGASGALVIVLIVSLDSPFRSDFRISPAAFTMQAPMSATE